MLYFHSWSGGKDSTASVILDHIHGLPPSKIIFSEVMFDKKRGISGELPEHIDFVMNKAKPLFESWGYTVEIVHAEKDYLDLFFHVLQRSKVEERIGKHVGWLLGGACAANRDLKIKPIRDYYKRLDLAGAEYRQYVGIAIDEPKRLERLRGSNKYRFSKHSGIPNKPRMIFARNGACFHLHTKYRSAAGAGFARTMDTQNLHTQKQSIRSYGKNCESLTRWKTLFHTASNTEKRLQRLKR